MSEPQYASRRARREAEARAAQATERADGAESAGATGPAELLAPPVSRRERRLREQQVTPAAQQATTAELPTITAPTGVPPLRSGGASASGAKPPLMARAHVRRNAALTAVVSSFGLASSLIIAGPAQADTTPNPMSVSQAAALTGTDLQSLRVSSSVEHVAVVSNDYSANGALNAVLGAGGSDPHAAAIAVSDAINAGGVRAKIVQAALAYLGVRYVLGGDSHSGIDCSGLTLRAYEAAGLTLPHYVPTQDAMGTRVSLAEALPGDLVVFNNEDHIGIYLGDGQVLHAPAPGRSVSIEAVSVWQPVGIHFTRLLG
ncbi:C40 family peptidase [Microbacterium sp. STN6]|uniref:C40 family peptidase n=1 Tax=Microbacterium sp. STN6 TaxID=2995588 RepID=UPI002260E766|nr:C40 family peptidase [Microbacterium sp. STN6]MCX7522602.1 C40 family peptidase [Microbacterium sp. STN6]